MRDGFADQEQRLHEEAIVAASCDDFGDPVYLQGLRALLAARDASGVDYPDGGETILAPIRQTLIARLTSLERIKRRPGGLAPVDRPMFILGLPRTGTTALQRLMMADPQMQGLEYWLGADPQPRPPRAEWAGNPSFVACRDAIEAMNAAAPLIAEMHPMAADEGEECRLVMEQSFGHSSFSLVAPIRPYQDWLFAADLTPHYRHYRQVLGLIGANDPGKTWVLKCPHHAPQADSLLRAFPDARLVMMHRPVEEVAPSVARLAEAFLGLVEGPGVDMTARAAMIVDNLELTYRRLLATRREHADRFFDVEMERFVADPLSVVADIYARFGLAMSRGSEAALGDWIAANHADRAQQQAVGPLPFGRDRADLRARFAVEGARL